MPRERDCTALRSDLTAFHQGELSRERAAEIEEHLEACSACREETARIAEVFRLAGTVEDVQPSLRFKRKLAALIRRARVQQAETVGEKILFTLAYLKHRLRTSRRFRFAAVSVAANAAILLLASLIVLPAVAERPDVEFVVDPEAIEPLVRSEADPEEQPLLVPFLDLVPFLEEGEEPLPVPRPTREVFPELPPEMVRLVPLLPPAEAHDRAPAAIFANVISSERRRAAFAAFEDPAATSAAVSKALAWLADHQQPDGSWEGSPRAPGYRTGVTACVILAFLSDGHSESRGLTKYRAVVKRGLDWLLAQQIRSEKNPLRGLIGPSESEVHYTYNHALATITLVEAASLDRRRVDPSRFRLLRNAVRDAISFIVRTQTPAGGWKYDAQLPPRQRYENDTSVSIFMVTALAAARSARFFVPEKSFRGFSRWLKAVTGENGIVGYARAGDRDRDARTLTAGALFLEETLGLAAPLRERQAKIVRAELESEKGTAGRNCLLRFFSALAFRVRGEPVLQRFAKSLLDTQTAGGSWVAAAPGKSDLWAVYGGDAFLSALNVLTLTTAFRAGA